MLGPAEGNELSFLPVIICEKKAAIPLGLISAVSVGFISCVAIDSNAFTDLAFGYWIETGDCCITLLDNI